MISDIHKFSATLNYIFRDELLLQQALTHRSCEKNHNERLEFLGDAVLSLIMAQALFLRFPNAKEGDLTRFRATLVKGETLANLARRLELFRYLKLGMGEIKSGGAHRDSILANAMESIIGAIYLDSDLRTCQSCVLALYEQELGELSLSQNYKDYKTRLQEYLQGMNYSVPRYTLVSISEEEHPQQFTVSCHCTLFADSVQGVGRNRRKAEQDAAQKMLGVLGCE